MLEAFADAGNRVGGMRRAKPTSTGFPLLKIELHAKINYWMQFRN